MSCRNKHDGGVRVLIMRMLSLLEMSRTDKELQQGLGTRVHGFFVDSQLLAVTKRTHFEVNHYNKMVLILLLQ